MKKDLSDITVVLDRSGSMDSLCSEVIGSFNTFVDDQKDVEGEATFTLIQFDDKYEVNYEAMEIKDVPSLNEATYVPRGMTALLDAVGRAIISTGKRLKKMDESERPEKVIFIIQTDGMENASKKYSVDVVKKMIKEQQDKYSWEFVFLGSNIDAVSTAEDMGIREGNAMTYANSPNGTREAFQSVSENLSFCRRNERSDMSFKEKDYKAQKKAGV